MNTTHQHTEDTPAYYVWVEDSLDGYYKKYCKSCDEFISNEF